MSGEGEWGGREREWDDEWGERKKREMLVREKGRGVSDRDGEKDGRNGKGSECKERERV